MDTFFQQTAEENQSELIIREARQEDAVLIATILRAQGLFGHINNEALEVTEQRVRQQLELASGETSCNTILVAERTNRGVVGYVAVHWFPNLMRGLDGYVSELFVHPDDHGNGSGSCLLNAVQDYAVKRGCVRLMLMNRRIRESYQRGFYRKQGWEELPDGAMFVRTLTA
jgi:GNAT superfamily N-acetyltransferase